MFIYLSNNVKSIIIPNGFLNIKNTSDNIFLSQRKGLLGGGEISSLLFIDSTSRFVIDIENILVKHTECE